MRNRINREISVDKVRLMGKNGEQIGIVTLKEAIRKAEEENVDLVEISPNAEPPVCRIIDYGKFIYEKNKFNKEQKKKQRTVQVKEIKFRPCISENDYKIKLRSLIKFIEHGDKVKITLKFRGREMMHQNIGVEVLNRIKSNLNELVIVEYFSGKIEGRQMTMIIMPKKK